jgi:hypothetical protein
MMANDRWGDDGERWRDTTVYANPAKDREMAAAVSKAWKELHDEDA